VLYEPDELEEAAGEAEDVADPIDLLGEADTVTELWLRRMLWLRLRSSKTAMLWQRLRRWLSSGGEGGC